LQANALQGKVKVTVNFNFSKEEFVTKGAEGTEDLFQGVLAATI